MKTFLHTQSHTYALPCRVVHCNLPYAQFQCTFCCWWVPPVRISDCIRRNSKPSHTRSNFGAFSFTLYRLHSGFCSTGHFDKFTLISSSFQHRTSHSIYLMCFYSLRRVERKIDYEDVFVSCYLLFLCSTWCILRVCHFAHPFIMRLSLGLSFHFRFAMRVFFSTTFSNWNLILVDLNNRIEHQTHIVHSFSAQKNMAMPAQSW